MAQLQNGRFVTGEYPSDKAAIEAEAKPERHLDWGISMFLDLTEEGEY